MHPDKSQDYCGNQIISVLGEHTVAAAGNTPTISEESPCRAKHFQTRCTFYLMQLKPGVCITETIAPPRDLESLQVSQQIKSRTIPSQVSKDLANISALTHHLSIS